MPRLGSRVQPTTQLSRAPPRPPAVRLTARARRCPRHLRRCPRPRRGRRARTREAADHVERHSGAPGLIEMQPVAYDDVEQLRHRQRLEPVVLEVVRRDQILATAAWGQKDPALAVVGSVGEELQREERMCGSAFAEVQLDRVRRPCAGLSCTTTKSTANLPSAPSSARRLPITIAGSAMAAV
jgi:hypothetical protein